MCVCVRVYVRLSPSVCFHFNASDQRMRQQGHEAAAQQLGPHSVKMHHPCLPGLIFAGGKELPSISGGAPWQLSSALARVSQKRPSLRVCRDLLVPVFASALTFCGQGSLLPSLLFFLWVWPPCSSAVCLNTEFVRASWTLTSSECRGNQASLPLLIRDALGLTLGLTLVGVGVAERETHFY